LDENLIFIRFSEKMLAPKIVLAPALRKATNEPTGTSFINVVVHHAVVRTINNTGTAA